MFCCCRDACGVVCNHLEDFELYSEQRLHHDNAMKEQDENYFHLMQKIRTLEKDKSNLESLTDELREQIARIRGAAVVSPLPTPLQSENPNTFRLGNVSTKRMRTASYDNNGDNSSDDDSIGDVQKLLHGSIDALLDLSLIHI